MSILNHLDSKNVSITMGKGNLTSTEETNILQFLRQYKSFLNSFCQQKFLTLNQIALVTANKIHIVKYKNYYQIFFTDNPNTNLVGIFHYDFSSQPALSISATKDDFQKEHITPIGESVNYYFPLSISNFSAITKVEIIQLAKNYFAEN